LEDPLNAALLRPWRAIVAALILLALAVPQAALAQSGPKPKDMLAPLSTFGDGYKVRSQTDTATKADVKYYNADKKIEVNPGIEIMPKDQVDQGVALMTVLVAAFGGKVEPAPDYGARGFKITFSDPATPNQVQVGYVWTVGDTVLAGVFASATNAADAEAVAAKGAQAQKPLVAAAASSPAPAAPAKPTATPPPAGPTNADAKALAIGLGTLGKGWVLDSVKPVSGPGGEYDVLFAAGPGSAEAKDGVVSAEIDVFIPNDPAIITNAMTALIAAAQKAGWAASLDKDSYGDRIGAQATLVNASGSGQMYAFAVGNTIAAITVVAGPGNLEGAQDLANTLSCAQATALGMDPCEEE
jgi:hypothetical protein